MASHPWWYLISNPLSPMYPSRFSDPDTKIYGNKSSQCKQADALVFESGFAEEVHWCKVGETEWVESNISYVTASLGEHLHFGMPISVRNVQVQWKWGVRMITEMNAIGWHTLWDNQDYPLEDLLRQHIFSFHNRYGLVFFVCGYDGCFSSLLLFVVHWPEQQYRDKNNASPRLQVISDGLSLQLDSRICG